jgi:hypothetical protein
MLVVAMARPQSGVIGTVATTIAAAPKALYIMIIILLDYK